jgi:hypothetical protein
MVTLSKDYLFGKSEELRHYETIKKYFDDNIILISNPYSLYDYKGTKYYYELKSRNHKFGYYNNTIIPVHKGQEKMIFIFNFIDGLYYIKYKEQKFMKFEKKIITRPNDKLRNSQLNYLIPINKLKKIKI